MPEKTAQARIPELDGLRGMAIFLVVAGHYTDFIHGTRVASFLQTSLYLYWTGVDLFFVLSGFLIGGILLDHRESASYFRTFYTRRFFRIVPLYYTWIGIYILLVTFGSAFLRAHVHTGTFQPVDRGILSHFLFLQNFGNPINSSLSFWWFFPLWSLAVEEQFYLISPLVVFLISRRSLTRVLGIVICCAPLLRILGLKGYLPFLGSEYVAFHATPCRADALAFGVLAALLWRDTRARAWLSTNTNKLYGAFGILLAGMAILRGWFPGYDSLGEQTFGYTWIALFYTVVLLLSLLSSSGPIARLARMGWLRELGKLSYCIYIIHSAVSFVCFKIRHSTTGVSFPHDLAITLLAVAITYTIAKLSWVFFEQPLLRLGHRFGYAPAPASPVLTPVKEPA
ncbi:MAG TPA: acyltransferase [Candidatus Acidoferrales bacterium]|jgi:peptidoglycan/LPS O-acetylase OafA/YrhL|nr:acyltransferase [Candidatus Acidoferrales bacterium]